MPTTTPNLGLTKDYEGEPYSLARINANSDRMDAFAGEALTDTVYDTTGTPALIKKRKIAGVETPVTIETPDTTPTEGSKHLITSGAVHAALGSKQDALSQAQLAAANSGITAEKLTADEAAIAEVVDNGAKNLVQIMQDSLSIYNIVFSVNKLEGTITITGSTASAYKAFRFFGDPDTTGWSYGIPIPKGTYVLSGLPSGASQAGVRYILGVTPSQSDARTTTQIYDGGYVFTIGNDTTRIDLAVYVPAGQDLSAPFVFKPIICTKAAWDVSQKIVPYCPTMAEMYAMILALQNGTRSAPAPAPALAKAEPEETEPETGEEEMR